MFDVVDFRSFMNVVLHNGWRCAAHIRLQQFFYSSRHLYLPYILATLINRRMLRVYGVDISLGSEFGLGLKIPHPVSIVIGSRVVVGDRFTVLHGVTIGEKNASGKGDGLYPIIGNDVLIGANSSILGNVYVGDGASIGAHSLVLKSVPSLSIVTGLYK
jgi:serine O-acetyltransferase